MQTITFSAFIYMVRYIQFSAFVNKNFRVVLLFWNIFVKMLAAPAQLYVVRVSRCKHGGTLNIYFR